MTELPTGWIETQISEIVELQANGKPFQQGWSPQCESRPANEGEWGVVKTTAIQHGEFWAHENKALPSKLEPKPLIEIRQGDILMTCAGPRNRCGVACLVKATRNKLMMSGKMYRFRPHPDALDPQFLSYFIGEHETQQLIDEMKTGISDSGLNLTHGRFALLPVRLPPLNEQRRIVEKIEAMFERIDKGVENLRAAKATLALYRQSLLKSAFEGRLTTDWRAQNADKLEDPKTLLARIQKERDTRYKAALDHWQTALTEWRDGGEKGKKPAKPKRIPNFEFQALNSSSPWPLVRVEAILRAPLINGRSVKDKAEGFPVLRLTALKNGKIVLSEHKQGNWTEDDARPFLIERDDIFLARGNGSKKLVGIAGRVMETPKPLAFPDTMIRVRLDTSAIRPEFFLFAWNSWTVRSQIEKAARTTAGIYKINQDHVSGFILPVPSISEQAEITRILDARLDAADKMEAEIDATLTRADALRQSILKQAFAGKLVSQDPTDEPATTLLARIKAERAKAPKPARTQKATV